MAGGLGSCSRSCRKAKTSSSGSSSRPLKASTSRSAPADRSAQLRSWGSGGIRCAAGAFPQRTSHFPHLFRDRNQNDANSVYSSGRGGRFMPHRPHPSEADAERCKLRWVPSVVFSLQLDLSAIISCAHGTSQSPFKLEGASHPAKKRSFRARRRRLKASQDAARTS